MVIGPHVSCVFTLISWLFMNQIKGKRFKLFFLFFSFFFFGGGGGGVILDNIDEGTTSHMLCIQVLLLSFLYVI